MIPVWASGIGGFAILICFQTFLAHLGKPTFSRTVGFFFKFGGELLFVSIIDLHELRVEENSGFPAALGVLVEFHRQRLDLRDFNDPNDPHRSGIIH